MATDTSPEIEPARPAQAPRLDPSIVVNHVCHVLVLRREGKVDEAIDSLVLAVLAADPSLRLRTPKGFAEAIEAYFSVRLDPDLLGEAIQRHFDAGRLVVGSSTGHYVLAPTTLADVQQRIADATDLETAVKNEWFEAVREGCGITEQAQLEHLWAALRAYIAKAFLRHGAETAVLLDPGFSAVDPVGGSLSKYQDDVIREQCPEVAPAKAKDALIRFFNMSSVSRTRYLAQLLDGTFTVFALSVDDATAHYLRSNLQPLKLFLDTNFIFGLLDIHTNPFADASREVVELLQGNNFPFQLYYHEETLREITNTLTTIGDRLRSQRWQQALSRAVVRSGVLTGVERRFHEKNAVQHIDPDIFMARFKDVQGSLKKFGIKLWRPNEKPTAKEDSEKWAIIADYNDFLKDRPKPYEAMNHDVAVWMDVERLRSKSKSAIEAGALFLSADYRLRQWVWRRRRSNGDVGSVVLPSQFLQLLRPFVQTTDDIDRRFVEVFALPEMRAYPVDYSSTVNEVLGVLNTVADMPEDAALRVLTDTMLMDSLRGERDHSKVEAAVELALARENQELIEEKEAALRAAKLAEDGARGMADLLSERESEIDRLRSEHREAVAREQTAQAKVDSLVADTSAAELEKAERIAELERQVVAAKIDADRLARRNRMLRFSLAIGAWLIGILVIAVVPNALIHWQWLDHNSNRLSLLAATAVIWTGLCWAVFDAPHRWVGGAIVAIGGLAAAIPLLGH